MPNLKQISIIDREMAKNYKSKMAAATILNFGKYEIFGSLPVTLVWQMLSAILGLS